MRDVKKGRFIMKKKKNVFCVFFAIMLFCAFAPNQASAAGEYAELARTSIKMDLGKAKILPSEKRKIYDFFTSEVVKKMRGRPFDDYQLFVIGYANNVGGNAKSNQRLADERAEVVRRFIENTWKNDPEKGVAGLQVSKTLGKVQGQEYDGIKNRFDVTGALIIFKQNLENFPVNEDDIYALQHQSFELLDQNDLYLSSKLDQLEKISTENNQIIKMDKKLSAAANSANNLLKQENFIFFLVAGVLLLILLLILIWPEAKAPYVVTQNGNIREEISSANNELREAINLSEGSVSERVEKVAKSVEEIQSNIKDLGDSKKQTVQKEADVANLEYKGFTYIVHLVNEDGLLKSPFRRPQGGVAGDYLKFDKMKGRGGAEKEIRRIFSRAQKIYAKDEMLSSNKSLQRKISLSRFWKNQIEELINSPKFEGPRIIQQEKNT